MLSYKFIYWVSLARRCRAQAHWMSPALLKQFAFGISAKGPFQQQDLSL